MPQTHTHECTAHSAHTTHALTHAHTEPHAQSFDLIVDTGSTMTYVPCRACERCGRHTSPPFDPAASSTSHQLACAEPSCLPYGGARCAAGMCYYSLSYAEASSSEGYLVRDGERAACRNRQGFECWCAWRARKRQGARAALPGWPGCAPWSGARGGARGRRRACTTRLRASPSRARRRCSPCSGQPAGRAGGRRRGCRGLHQLRDRWANAAPAVYIRRAQPTRQPPPASGGPPNGRAWDARLTPAYASATPPPPQA